jgi:hypothetical protein
MLGNLARKTNISWLKIENIFGNGKPDISHGISGIFMLSITGFLGFQMSE